MMMNLWEETDALMEKSVYSEGKPLQTGNQTTSNAKSLNCLQNWIDDER